MPSTILANSFDQIFEGFGLPTRHASDLIIVKNWMTPKLLLSPPSEEVKTAFFNIQNQWDDLIDLYMNDVRSHFFAHASPLLSSLIDTDPFTYKEAFRLVDVLNDLKKHYYFPFEYINVTERQHLRFKLCYLSLLNGHFTPQIFQLMIKAYFTSYNLCTPDQKVLDAVAIFREMGKDLYLNQLILKQILRDFETLARKKYEKVWDCSVLQDMETWINETVLPSSRELLPQCETDIPSIIANFSSEIIASLRTEELFDIVVDYPDSRPGLEDLKVNCCL